MSHIVKLATKMTDLKAIEATCRRLGLEAPRQGSAKLYSGQPVKGTIVNLPGWKYPVVIGQDGTVSYDNYGGSWGRQEELNKFQQSYGLAVAQQMAESQGWTYEEVPVENGAIEAHLVQYG